MTGAAEPRFTRFAAIDWSGAATEYPDGIAVAMAGTGHLAPTLVGARWSRQAVTDWILAEAAVGDRLIVGLDLSFGLPFADRGAYLPGWPDTPPNARALWHLVERLSAGDPHLGAGGVLAAPEVARHFRQRGRCGDLFPAGRGRLRGCEAAMTGLSPSSVFNLVGAAQVGKASLSGMRMLARLDGRVPIWPFDPPPAAGPVVVEIYTAIALRAAARRTRAKIRDAAALGEALAALGSAAPVRLPAFDDHRTDAIVTAAWLRTVANDAALWRPASLDPATAATEGWTFGVA